MKQDGLYDILFNNSELKDDEASDSDSKLNNEQALISIYQNRNKAIVLMPSGFVPNGKARESCVIHIIFHKWFDYLRVFPCAASVQGFLIFWLRVAG